MIYNISYLLDLMYNLIYFEVKPFYSRDVSDVNKILLFYLLSTWRVCSLFVIDVHSRYAFVGRVTFWRDKLKEKVHGNAFRNGILVSILINTVMMGIEHHNQVYIQ